MTILQTKTKTCQNCKAEFIIEPEDFAFYKKIDVPEPTFCPTCRFQRRMVFRNHRKLYKRKDDFTGQEIIASFHSKSPYKVYEQKIWWSDKWDPMEYGRDYNFNKPFFEQFKELMKATLWPNIRMTNSVNCDYCNGMMFGKNCYMSSGYQAENCLHMDGAAMSRECVDSSMAVKSERIYEGLDCSSSYNLLFSTFCDNCIDSAFLYNCRNCQSCFGCVNLRNKKYHIFNRPYSKTEYQKEIKKYDIGSYKVLLTIEKKFRRFNLGFPRPWAMTLKSVDVSGENIRFSKNCHWCFNVTEGAEDSKFLHFSGLALKDSYDINAGGGKSELLYESDFILASQNIIASVLLANCIDVSYSSDCSASANLFGCVGLRHKKYCILNKQYSKEEYKKMIGKIKEQMNKAPYKDKRGRLYKYGEFFPIELSRFGYNETSAQVYFPLNKKQANEQGYNWYERPESEYQPTIKAKDLPDNIKDVDDSILKQIIECDSLRRSDLRNSAKVRPSQEQKEQNCAGSGVFRIISSELKFYQKHNLPLPRLCPDCRSQVRTGRRNTMRLYQRQCQCAGEKSSNKVYKNTVEHFHKDKHCPNAFQTTYAPNKKEIVYCEACYLKEVG